MIRIISLCCIVLLFLSCQKKKSSNYTQPYHSSSQTSKNKPQKEDPKLLKGEAIFDSQCAACHRMNRKLVGPALENITKRHNKEWVMNFIIDNQDLIKKKDSAALAIWLEYNKSPMPNFKHLTEEELQNLYYYLEHYRAN